MHLAFEAVAALGSPVWQLATQGRAVVGVAANGKGLLRGDPEDGDDGQRQQEHDQ